MSHAKGTDSFMLNPDPPLNTAGKPWTTADEAIQDAGTAVRPADKPLEAVGGGGLSVALIGPDDSRRSAISGALAWFQDNTLRVFASYPPGLDDVPRLLEQHYDVIIIDLDSDPEYALELVESIGADGTGDGDGVFGEGRSGAAGALHARRGAGVSDPSVRRTILWRRRWCGPRRGGRSSARVKKAAGKLLAFMGAKGGAGVTTLACNFAVALAQESGQRTLLIDLDLPLGDAALNLGIVTEFSTIDALRSSGPAGRAFLSHLLVKHSSGVWRAGGSGQVCPVPGQQRGDRPAAARWRGRSSTTWWSIWVRSLDLTGHGGCSRKPTTIYLVTQAGIPELRNSNRLISQFFAGAVPKLEIVINRYESRDRWAFRRSTSPRR